MDGFDRNFTNAEDFVQCINNGCEVEFMFGHRMYSITWYKKQIVICEAYNELSEKRYNTPLQALDFQIGDKKLGDILDSMKIIFRTF